MPKNEVPRHDVRIAEQIQIVLCGTRPGRKEKYTYWTPDLIDKADRRFIQEWCDQKALYAKHHIALECMFYEYGVFQLCEEHRNPFLRWYSRVTSHSHWNAAMQEMERLGVPLFESRDSSGRLLRASTDEGWYRIKEQDKRRMGRQARKASGKHTHRAATHHPEALKDIAPLLMQGEIDELHKLLDNPNEDIRRLGEKTVGDINRGRGKKQLLLEYAEGG